MRGDRYEVDLSFPRFVRHKKVSTNYGLGVTGILRGGQQQKSIKEVHSNKCAVLRRTGPRKNERSESEYLII